MREKADFVIKREIEYENIMVQIEELMDKGEANLTLQESDEIRNKALAKELGVSDTKLSLIIHGRQKPDISYIKAVHTKLNVPADFILKHI